VSLKGSVELPGLFELPLSIQPHSDFFSVFFVKRWNVAIAFPLFVLNETREHFFPFVSEDIPNHTNIFELAFLGRIQISILLELSLRV